MLEQILEFFRPIAGQLLDWAMQYPAVAIALMAIGVLRLCMKPLMDLARTFVLATPGEGDDAWLAKLEASRGWQVFLYVLDWIGSIKTPARKMLEKRPESK